MTSARRLTAILLLAGTGALPAAVPALAQGAAAQPARLVARAVDVIGGAEALRRLAVTTMEFNSASFGLGQEETPESPPRATLSWGRITTDWHGARRAVEQESRAVTGAVTRARQVVAGGRGMNETGASQAAMAPAAVAGVLRGIELQPHRMLLTALDNPSRLRPLRPRTFRGEVMDGVRLADGADTVSLWFDRPSGLLVVSEIVADDDITGDRQTLTWYTRWQPVEGASGVRLPRQVDTEVTGRLLSHNVVTSYRMDTAVDPGLFAIPDSIAGRTAPVTGPVPSPPVVVTLVELAPGVWRAEGGTHFSLVVEQGSRLVVVELPQSRARGTAVLDTLRARFPGRTVATVVNTHHHHDHAGGIRVALARGLPVATHARNAAFIRSIGTARKTARPDALSRAPRAPVMRPVSDTLVLGTGDHRVVLLPVPSVHAEGILAAYLPGSRLLFVADVLTPGPVLNPVGSAELVALVRARNLVVDRVVGAHGGIAPWADVERAAARQ